ncbi:ATP-dependent helicase/nuclease subunit A [Rhodovulum iodosum]|uniref:DNA 3'-5' helicase n=1 Tax=Rhodovulum iodosum TaxID=68291 RepID=A0ABV3XSB0_9RHOB|nr:double-strand break repair helicase AddA [Rhodovulum robiginosum]RSK30307.1 double-strand break repair helicase AddA [Rhodovulum robiginosum]
MTRDAATERQVQAARPDCSTWLSANAGSGKTRVLTDRVARLLLNEVPPQRILCLTYTKAAASEMQNRLFRRLGAWAMLDDAPLRDELRQLGVDSGIGEAMLRRARRLFARAIETPGGLKIQTIHSFCAGLLRRFPLEAGVSPQFSEMDDRAARHLRAEIVEEIANGPEVAAFDALAEWHTSDDLDGLTAEIAGRRAAFADRPDAGALWRQFGLAPGTDAADVLAGVFLGGEAGLLARLGRAMAAGSTNDIRAADKLAELDPSRPDLALLKGLEGLFLTGEGAKAPFSAKIGSFPTKTTRGTLGPDLDALDALMARVEAARHRRIALAAAQRTLALHRFAAVFLPAYAARKEARGWLDFDDLILKARALLTDPGVAQWVLFRLDGGIDHILVDEAQDTSPVQWEVIDLLSHEFTTGYGARNDVARTIFVVGDKKQSIYSFQGADPEEFDRMKDHVAGRLGNVALSLQDLQLEYSFRSADAVLRLVDCTFPEGARQGLGREMLHRAFRAEMPGRVDLWPLVERSENPEKPHWADPVDMLTPEHHTARLARRVAEQIRAMVEGGAALWDAPKDGPARRRPVTEGDVLILVQRRSDLFHEIIRACKSEGLAVAGADRLKIGGEMAVRDLTALLSFLATPEDSLSLAAALRSPLFGWGEGAVYDLAQGRGKQYLWQVLRARDCAESETLSALLDDADFLRPYDLIDRILTRHDGRRRLIARLGEEAEDGIDALLAQALAYERMEVPSLTGFLAWMESDEVEIKRQLDSAGNRLRVMTVHGAKGLEAPIVILPDTLAGEARLRAQVVAGDGGQPLWRGPADQSPPAEAEAVEALRVRQEEERARLLYVAMTRAEQWLIVCGAGEAPKSGTSWYQKVAAGMERSGALPFDFGFGEGKRLETGDWAAGDLHAPDRTEPEAPALPGWATARATPPPRAPQPLSPSDLGGDKALPGEAAGRDAEAAKARGTWVHALLEHLPGNPRPDRAAVAAQILAAIDPPAPDAALPDLLEEAERVLDAPHLAKIFAPETLAEVEIAADLPAFAPRMLEGTIDRLLIGPDRVLAVDFKTNAVVPASPEDVPEGLLRQMGAYAAALAQIYPGRTVETAILWTRAVDLMPLPDALITAALGRAAPA